MNSYCGYIWWDEETDGEHMYPPHERKLSSERTTHQLADRQPGRDRRSRQLVRPRRFLNNVTDLNSVMNKTQFADFHGHGWVFRAIFRHDREGRLLDGDGKVVTDVTPQKLQEAVRAPGDRQEDLQGTL